MKHYLHSDEYGPFLRQLLSTYSIFAVGVVFTGGLVFFIKTGFDPRLVFEYYRGSEAVMLEFADFQDHFVNPRTFAGLLKLAVPHFLGYALLIFITSHLARSLELPLNHLLAPLSFGLAVLDLSCGFIMLIAPYHFVYIRLIIFFAFIFILFFHNLLLAAGAIKNSKFF